MKAITSPMPAVIYDQLVTDMGFDPAARFNGARTPRKWKLPACEPMEPSTIRGMIEEITGCDFDVWKHTDQAQMLEFLNSQNTAEYRIIEGESVTAGS